MELITHLVLLLAQVFGLAAAPAAITGVIMRNGGEPPRGFARTFRLAYPPWLLSFAVLAGVQWWWSEVMGNPIAETPALVMLGILVMGGYGAVYFIRGSSPRL